MAASQSSDLLGDSPTMVNLPPPPSSNNDQCAPSDNIATALSSTGSSKPAPQSNSSNDTNNNRWGSMVGDLTGSLVNSARSAVNTVAKQTSDLSSSNSDPNSTTSTTTQSSTNNTTTTPTPSSGGNAFFTNLTSNITTSVSSATNSISTSSTFKSITNNIAGRNTMPDKTTASQVLMFRQLLHTKCRPGLRLSRVYQGTAAQKAVLHMPWWERGIEQSKKMIISYDNLITRLWLSGAIMPFEKGGYATLNNNNVDGSSPGVDSSTTGSIDTLINEKGLPPIPHKYWVDRLGFQQDDPVTDFRSGGVLSLAMLVHIVESCPLVHSRFVPKPKADSDATSSYISSDIISLEEIITDDASVLPFGITCINITDMLAKFLLFSKAVDKMDALLSSKPFWKMFIDPNAMLVLQEVSLDLLCDVCVEIGRERRIEKLKNQAAAAEQGSEDDSNKKKKEGGMPGSEGGKVTVFDFSEIMERTEKRVGDEVLGAGPQTVGELRAVARRVKSKYLMRIQLKEKHAVPQNSPLRKQVPPLPSKESVKNVTSSVIGGVAGGVGGFVSLLKRGDSAVATKSEGGPSSEVIDFSPSNGTASILPNETPTPGQEVEVNIDGTTSSSPVNEGPKSPVNPFASSSAVDEVATEGAATTTATKEELKTTAGLDGFDELDKLSAELGDLSTDAFDLLGDDFDLADLDDMDTKVDALGAFAIGEDEDDLLS